MLRAMKRRRVARWLRQAVTWRRQFRGPYRPSWSVDFEIFARVLHHYSKRSAYVPVAVQRRALKATVQVPATSSTQRKHTLIGGVPVTFFSRSESQGDALVLYFHGGGYALGSVDGHAGYLADLCRRSGVVICAVDYRLAPEHPFPAALEDALAVWEGLRRQGYTPERTVVAGDSAGGGLSLALTLSLRDARRPLPRALALLSPWVDLELRGESIDRYADVDFLSRNALVRYVRRYVQRTSPTHPLVSPVHALLEGLPRMLIQIGGVEALVSENEELTRRARRAGVDVTLSSYDDMIHAFSALPFCRQAKDARNELAAFIQNAVGSGDSRA